MLNQKIVELSNRIVEVEFEQLQFHLKDEIQKLDDEFRLAGQWKSPRLVFAVKKLCNQEVITRMQVVWESLVKVLSAQSLDSADGLGDALKEEVLRYRDSIVAGPTEELRKTANRIAPTAFSVDLTEGWEHARKKVFADIDFFILSNQAKTAKREGHTNINRQDSQIATVRTDVGTSMKPAAPKAFLSHSSADNAMAEKLAMDLRKNGVDVWYDAWELRPGDSLRRKIDQGIESASYFIVLLTPTSLKSEWVQTELDAAMVNRIEGSSRLLPIVWNLSGEDIPVTLRGLKWVELEPYEDGLRDLLNVCHDVHTKPPLGARPAWAAPRLPADLGLSVHAQRLAVLLAERSENGLTLDPMLEASKVLEELQLTETEAATAADELDERGWVKRHVHLGMGNVGFGRISPTALLFFNLDPHVKGWNSEADARTLAAVLVNRGNDIVPLKDADQMLGWGPRRFNPAAQLLHLHNLASGHAILGCAPYAFQYLQVTPRTKRFAS
jgi:hypothetical protein